MNQTKFQKKKIIICGNFGVNNIGDEAILSGAIKILQNTFKNTKITACSANKIQTEKMHKIQAIDFFPSGIRSALRFVFLGKFIAYFKALIEADFFVLGGGGLFSDEKPQAIWIWYLQARIAHLFGKKILCLGQSVGPLKTKWARNMTKKVFQWAEFVSVRDEKSAELLKELKISNVHINSDFAFAMAYEVESFYQKSDYIILSFREWFDLTPNHYQKLASLIEKIYQRYQLKTVFLPFQTKQHNDLEIADQIQKYLKQPDILTVSQIFENHETFENGKNNGLVEVLELISRANFVIGMRLHSLILSIICKKPFLGISYSSKVKDFLMQNQLNSWIEYENFLNEDLLELVDQTIENHEKQIKLLEKVKMQNTYQLFALETALEKAFVTDLVETNSEAA